MDEIDRMANADDEEEKEAGDAAGEEDEVEDEDVDDAYFDWLQQKCSLDHLCHNFDP